MTDSHGSPPSPDDDLACRRFRVQGHVQGVFFRASTQTVARDLGLGGYARNLSDGTVEVLACGAPTALDQLEAWLQDGPPMASVSKVTAEALPFEERDNFTTG